MFKTPILLLIFNRPDDTQQVFDRVRQIKPTHLYISSDGARSHKVGEAKQVADARKIVEQIDWNCKVHTLFRTENLGCRTAVSGGISWFFEQVERGIILEDDCVPDLSFFQFCEELLHRYQDEPKVMQIGGSNLMWQNTPQQTSYIFSKFVPIWGWATWRRAWQLMDVDMTDFYNFKINNTIADFVNVKPAQQYMLQKFEDTHLKRNSSWAYAWFYSVLLHDGVSIIPTRNLIHNIGFGEAATHMDGHPAHFAMKSEAIAFPLKHPKTITTNQTTDQQFFYTTQKSKKLLFANYLLPKSLINLAKKIIGKS